MNIKEQNLEKLEQKIKAAVNNYHNKVRVRHDFVNSMIISGANQDYKCADCDTADTADTAIHVTDEFNEHVDLPNMCFTRIMFGEAMELEYVFEMYVERLDGFIDLIYTDKSLRFETNINWGIEFADLSDEIVIGM